VVAGEVRNLAQRCATAASEITQLIKASVTDVDTGVGQVAKAGSSMNEILEAVGSVSGIMGEMTEASKAQIHAITGIDSAVGKINADAQQNAAIVEQTASAAALLHEQVGVLVESVGHFTFGSERDTPAAAHSPPHATTVAATPARRVA
jgi:methyl-accepting chemotaxis protein